jgi:hypothetical protein
MKRFFLCALTLSLAGARWASAQTNDAAMTASETRASNVTDIRPSQLENVAIRVATLKIDRDVARLHVGDTLSFADLVVTAYDSAGAAIGRLRQFDSTLRPNQFVVASAERRFIAVAEGSAEMILQYPRAAWFSRADAPLVVHIRIDVVR